MAQEGFTGPRASSMCLRYGIPRATLINRHRDVKVEVSLDDDGNLRFDVERPGKPVVSRVFSHHLDYND